MKISIENKDAIVSRIAHTFKLISLFCFGGIFFIQLHSYLGITHHIDTEFWEIGVTVSFSIYWLILLSQRNSNDG